MDGEARTALERQIGRLLEVTRESRGLSLEEAQRATTIHAHQLRSLERGDLEDLEMLHGPVWTRAFLVRYASLLGLDGEELAEQVLPLEDLPSRKGFFSRHRRALAGVLGALTLLLVAALIVIYWPSQSPLGDEPQRVALIFDAGTTAGSDSAMVAKIAQDDSGLLLIPGNTVIEIPGHGTGEAATALTLGGPDLLRQSMAQLTAVEVPYYVLIDEKEVKEVVDMMGGIQVDVPNPVSGHTSAGGAPVTLQPGLQTLNGDQVLVYLQGEDLSGEDQRVERQRALLDVLFRQAFTARNLLSHPTSVYAIIKNTETNMSSVEAVRLASRARSLIGKPDATTQVSTIPGHKETADLPADEGQDGSWVLNAQELPTVLHKTLQ